MLSPLIKLQERYLKLEEVLPEPQTMTQWDLKPDLSTALRDKSKKERKWSIQSLFMKLMSSTQGPKASWPSSQELLDR